MGNASLGKTLIRQSLAAGLMLSLPLALGSMLGIDGQLGGTVAAAESSGQGSGQGQPHKGSGAGGPGGKGSEAKGKSGSTRDVLEAADEDSDRPAWAGGAKEENPHRGEGNPNPGVNKGDLYGDLWVYERNPITGEVLEFDADGNACEAGEDCFVHVIVCADEACDTTEIFTLASGEEMPEGVTPLEVDFGRLNLGRAPTKVIDHAEDEAMAKITADDAVLGLDPAGRITVNGATIDSPLENLAIYTAIMTGDQVVLNALEPLLDAEDMTALDLAAIMLASAADKTGDIDIDTVWYLNSIYGFTPSGDYVDYTNVSYDRSFYDEDLTYFYMDGENVVSGTVNLEDYLNAINPIAGTEEGITLFAIAADDAVEIIELVHTQIHDAALPGSQ